MIAGTAEPKRAADEGSVLTNQTQSGSGPASRTTHRQSVVGRICVCVGWVELAGNGITPCPKKYQSARHSLSIAYARFFLRGRQRRVRCTRSRRRDCVLGRHRPAVPMRPILRTLQRRIAAPRSCRVRREPRRAPTDRCPSRAYRRPGPRRLASAEREEVDQRVQHEPAADHLGAAPPRARDRGAASARSRGRSACAMESSLRRPAWSTTARDSFSSNSGLLLPHPRRTTPTARSSAPSSIESMVHAALERAPAVCELARSTSRRGDAQSIVARASSLHRRARAARRWSQRRLLALRPQAARGAARQRGGGRARRRSRQRGGGRLDGDRRPSSRTCSSGCFPEQPATTLRSTTLYEAVIAELDGIGWGRLLALNEALDTTCRCNGAGRRRPQHTLGLSLPADYLKATPPRGDRRRCPRRSSCTRGGGAVGGGADYALAAAMAQLPPSSRATSRCGTSSDDLDANCRHGSSPRTRRAAPARRQLGGLLRRDAARRLPRLRNLATSAKTGGNVTLLRAQREELDDGSQAAHVHALRRRRRPRRHIRDAAGSAAPAWCAVGKFSPRERLTYRVDGKVPAGFGVRAATEGRHRGGDAAAAVRAQRLQPLYGECPLPAADHREAAWLAGHHQQRERLRAERQRPR